MRRWAATISAVVAAAGSLIGLGTVGLSSPAGANPSGASPGVFVVGPGSTGNGPVVRTTVAAIDSGGASGASPTTLGSRVTAAAINTRATKVAFGLLSPPAGIAALPPRIAVEDLSTSALSSVPTKASPIGIAADPTNPNQAYVLESVPNPSGGAPSTEIDTVGLSTSPPSDTLLVNLAIAPSSIAISPDGSTLFVGGNSGGDSAIEAVQVANTAQTALSLTGRRPGSVVDLAVAPSGNSLYAVQASGSGSSASGLFGFPLPLPSAPTWFHNFSAATAAQLETPTSVTVSPDGTSVYVAGNQGAPGAPAPSAVQQFKAADGTPGASTQVPIQTSGNGPGGISSESVTPDGRQLIVAGTDGTNNSTSVYSLALPSLSLGAANNLGTEFGILGGPQELAITPDQAPVAAFTSAASAAGSASTFNAGGSSVTYGSVNQFHWTFGDGQSQTTGVQTTSHTYAVAGTYTVTLVETDSAGTSVPPAVGFTFFSVNGPGQTPFRRADVSATVTHQISIPPPGTTPTTLPPGTPGTPTLVLNPALGTPGTLVTVTGSGFPHNTPITVSWSTSTGSVVITSDGSGNLPGTVLPVLVPDVLGPRFAVASSTPAAQAPFLVVPGSAEPGGSQGSYLFRTEGP